MNSKKIKGKGTKSEQAGIAELPERSGEAPIKIKVVKTEEGGSAREKVLCLKSDTEESTALAVKEYFGTADDDLQLHLLDQVIRSFEGSTTLKGVASEENLIKACNIAISILHGIKPLDQIEAMLAVQMISVHNLIMQRFSGAMMEGQSIDGIERRVNQATKMLRTFTTQMEALKRYRTGGSQKMTIEHIHIEGGQAIVGNVNQEGGGGDGKRDG